MAVKVACRVVGKASSRGLGVFNTSFSRVCKSYFILGKISFSRVLLTDVNLRRRVALL